MKHLTFILVVVASLLAACATPATIGRIEGVKITDEERAECAQSQDCTVWSQATLQGLINFVWRKAQEAKDKDRW